MFNDLFWLPWTLVVILSLALAALYYHNHRLKSRYLELSSLDKVSKLKNQVAILAGLEYLLNTAVRYHHALTIGMLQIPELNSARKAHGDSSVDNYVIKTGNILQEELRSTDLLGRYDYDKFLLVLTNTSSHDARAVFSRVIKRVESQSLHSKTLKSYLGMTNRHSKTNSVTGFVNEAEKALRSARQIHGKNIQGFQVERFDR